MVVLSYVFGFVYVVFDVLFFFPVLLLLLRSCLMWLFCSFCLYVVVVCVCLLVVDVVVADRGLFSC